MHVDHVFVKQVHAHDYQAELPKATWLGMMRARFWSTFSHCTAEELEQARGGACRTAVACCRCPALPQGFPATGWGTCHIA